MSKQLDDTRWLAYRNTYDGFGRPIFSEASESGLHALFGNFSIFSKAVYDGLGRVKFATNPCRATESSTDGWTRTAYDLAGRVIEVATFGGSPSAMPPDYPATSGAGVTWTGSVVTAYNGEQTTMRDQANKQRRSTVDGLGRLIKVDEMFEAPSTAVYATTTYGYDARGNLKAVSQGGGQQTRNFSYDGLSRLVSAINPESGRVDYQYDLASNLTQKTDARVPAVVTTYGYDSLNRVRTRTYSDGTPAVTYNYDMATNGVGRVASVVTTGVSSYNYTTYDALGRVTAYNQTTDGHVYTMSAAYNKAGLMTDETYPSLKVVHTDYDAAGRIAGVKNQVTGDYWAGGASSDAGNRIQYTSHGALSAMKLGNNLWEHTTFNSRLQPTQIGLGTAASGASSTSVLGLDYGYGSSDNNGNVQSQTITVGTSVMVQSYGYDRVNRLTQAKETVSAVMKWQQDFGYDIYGNRASLVHSGTDSGSLPSPNAPQVSATNNRLTTFVYDNVGNVITDGSGNGFTYDGENKQVSFTPAGGAGQPAGYWYDGDGHRVKKVVGVGAEASTTIFVYNASGQMLAEYTTRDPQPQAGGGVSYLTVDHLGSTRVVTNSTGGVKSRYDYLPFGQELSSNVSGRTTAMGYSAAHGLRQKFTQKERDAESGLDYFLARYYSSVQGRFTGVDPLLSSGKTHRPESWNRYSYCYNNPLRYLDPDGKKVKAEDEKALRNIRNTLPASIRNQVKLDKNGFIDKKALNRIKSTDANFLDLKKMVNSSTVVEVATAKDTVLPQVGRTEFSYQSVEAQRSELIQNVTPTLGKEMAEDAARQITIPSAFDGNTLTPAESSTGNLRVELSDQTGAAATEPDSQMAVTTAHEMYGHALGYMEGKPFQHDDHGPVDHRIHQIEERTKRNFPTERPNKTATPPK